MASGTTLLKRIDIYISRLDIDVYNGKTIYIWVTPDNEHLFHSKKSTVSSYKGYLVCKLTNGVKS